MIKEYLNVGVLGFANVFKKHMERAFEESKYFVVKKIATRKGSLVSELYSGNNQVKIVSNYDEVVGDSDIDLVYIPLPNNLHYEWISKSLENGKHVLVEKPLVLNNFEFNKISQLAKSRNLVVKQNFMFEYHSQFKFIKEQIGRGVIGDIRSINTSFGFPPFEDSGNIRYSPILGGGSLNDAGSYGIMICSLLLDFSDCYSVSSSLCYDRKRNVDIFGGAFLIDRHGKFAHISFGFDNYYQCNLEIWGSIGKISARRIFTAGPGVKAEVILEVSDKVERKIFDSENHFVQLLDNLFYDIKNVTSYNETMRHGVFINLLDEIRSKASLSFLQ